jgi:hypothetical protein
MIDQVIDDYEDATGVDSGASSTSAERQGSAGAKYYEGKAATAAVPAVAALADHSSSGRTVTAVNGAAISTTQKQFGTHGIFFDGSNDHLTIPASTDFNFAGDFTFECWVYWDGTSSDICNIDAGLGGGQRDFRVFFEGTKFKVVMQDIGANDYLDNASIVSANTWTHVAAVRSGNTLTGYGNGVAMNNPITLSGSIAGTSTLHIGGPGDTGSDFGGYMDEIRLSNTARYTAAFTPSTIEFVPDSNTLLLLHANAVSAVAATPASDSISLISTTTTTTGTAPTKASIVLQTEDATGTATVNTHLKAGVSRNALDYVDTTLAKISTWGSGNVYAANDVTMPGTVTKVITVAASKYVIDGTSQLALSLTEGYTYRFDTSDSTNATHHFKFATAADAAGSTQYTTGVTYNGTSGSAGAYTQIVVAASAPDLYYYCHYHASMGGQATTDVEILPLGKGAMRYRIDTKNQSYTAGIGAYQDHSSTGHTVTSETSVVASTTQVRTGLGTHSLYYDGTGDWLEAASSSDWTFGTSDFTVEFWYYGSNNASGRTPFMSNLYAGGSSNDGWGIRNHTGYLKLFTWNTDIGSGSSILTPVNTWTHLAVTSSSRTIKIWVNGVQGASFTNSYSFTAVKPLLIGRDGWPGGYNASNHLNGYLDEIRVSNVARYSANFTAFGQGGGTISNPTPFTNDSNTKLLIHSEAQAASGKITRVHGTSLAWS